MLVAELFVVGRHSFDCGTNRGTIALRKVKRQYPAVHLSHYLDYFPMSIRLSSGFDRCLTEDPVQEIINSTSLPPQMRSDLPRGFYRLDFRLNEGDLLIQKVPSCGKILRQFIEWLCRVRTIRFFEVFFLTGEVISATQEMHYFRHRSRRS